MREFTVVDTMRPAEAINTTGLIFVRDSNVSVQVFEGGRVVVVVDVADAMKHGKECRRISFSGASLNDHGLAVYRHLCGFDGWEYVLKYGDTLVPEGVQVHVTPQKSAGTFSPFATLNPLPCRPKKWTLAHLRRALFNGQASAYCRMHLTDDYLHDAATDFQRGDVDAMKLCRELTESPSGYRVRPYDENTLSLACHSFLYYDITLKGI